MIGLVGLGCFRLYRQLGAVTNSLWLQSMVPAAVFVILGIVVYLVLNKPVVADFLISAETELRRVNWPSRQEVFAATAVVVVVVVILAGLLGFSDLLLQVLFDRIL